MGFFYWVIEERIRRWKMKTSKIAILLVSLIITVGNVHADYNYNAPNPNNPDGSWEIDFTIEDNLTIDYFSPEYPGNIPDPGTTVALLENGWIKNGDVSTYNNGHFIMYGGIVSFNMKTYDNSTADLYGGDIGTAHLLKAVIGYDYSEINIYGGYGTDPIAPRIVYAYNNAVVNIHSNTDSDYYGNLRDAPFSVWGYNDQGIGRWFGDISGTYVNGDNYRIHYEIYDDAQIISAPIPEPCALSLLAIGGLLLKRRKA